MICNITKGNDFYGCLTYVLEGDARLITTNMSGDSPTELAWEFRFVSNRNELTQKPVLHLSFNPEPNDRPLNKLEYSMICQDLLNGLELEDNQFLLVEHRDTEFNGKVRPHCHIVINRVNFNGKCNDDSHDYYRAQKVLRQIEKDYKLIECPSSWEVEQKKGPPLRQDETKYIQEAIKKAASDKPEMPTFISRLQDNNIDVNCRITRTGKFQGISYSYNGKAFKGRQLGKSFTHLGIQSHLGVIHKPIHKKQIELLINAPKGNSDSTNESITDNTSVVESARPSYKSFVPSIEETFGTYESNKAKKQLMIEKAKNNNKEISNSDNTDAVTPPPQSYKSFVPSIEEVFPRFKDIEEEENIIQADTNIETQPPASPEPEPEPTSTPEPETEETAPEPEAVKYAVIIAGYMAAQDTHEIKGDIMKATLSPDAERLTVQRVGTNEVILSGYYSPMDGSWMIGNSKKFTEEEKKRITQLKERSSEQVQQTTAEKKGFEQ